MSPGAILLADNFDQPAQGWLPSASNPQTGTILQYTKGEYLVQQVNPREDRRPAAFLPGEYGDASLAVDARLEGATEQRYVALGCRTQSTSESHYRLVVVPHTGHVALVRWDGNAEVMLTPWQVSAAVRTGTQTNRVQLTCGQSMIAATINGTQIAAVLDTTYRNGLMWLGAGSSSGTDAAVTAYFDNLLITQEEDGRSASPSVKPRI